jgi:hypothetical protein
MTFLTRTRDRAGRDPEVLPAASADGGCCSFDLIEDDEQTDEPT